jgi:plastocyanin
MRNRFMLAPTVHHPRSDHARFGVDVARRLGVMAVGVVLIVGCSNATNPSSSETSVARTSPLALVSATPIAASASPSPKRTAAATPGPIGTTTVASSPPPGAIAIRTEGDAFRYTPSAITVDAGTVSFFISNVRAAGGGGRQHDMAIGATLGRALVKSAPIDQGRPAIFTVQDLPPGDYVYFCTVKEGGSTHYAVGMKGTLTVTR